MQRHRLLTLLSHTDRSVVLQGIALADALAEHPEVVQIQKELAEQVRWSRSWDGWLTLSLPPSLVREHHSMVVLWALSAQGVLAERLQEHGVSELRLRGFEVSDSAARLQDLPLTGLSIRDERSLRDLSLLASFPELTRLDLTRCSALESLRGIAGLSRLDSLTLTLCRDLADLDGIEHCTNLRRLDLRGCRALRSLSPLQTLTTLTDLNLNACSGLVSVDGLERSTALTSLDLRYCSSLRSLRGLSGLTNITSLSLEHCRSLPSLDGLSGCPSLTTLDLRQCSSLRTLDGLAGLTRLSSLNLRGCRELQSIDALAGCLNLSRVPMRGTPRALRFRTQRLMTLRPDLQLIFTDSEA